MFFMKSYYLFNAINGMSIASNSLYISNQYLVYKILDITYKIAIAEVLFETYDHKQELKPEFFNVNATVIQREEFTSVFVIDVMPEFENRCLLSECSHICIPIGQSHRCVCPHSYTLVNETNCEITDNPKKVEIYTKKKEDQLIIPFSLDSKREHVIETSKTNVIGIINLILILFIITILCLVIIFLFL